MKTTTKLLQDMLQAIDAIQSYAASNYEAFLNDEKSQDRLCSTSSSWEKLLTK